MPINSAPSDLQQPLQQRQRVTAHQEQRGEARWQFFCCVWYTTYRVRARIVLLTWGLVGVICGVLCGVVLGGSAIDRRERCCSDGTSDQDLGRGLFWRWAAWPRVVAIVCGLLGGIVFAVLAYVQWRSCGRDTFCTCLGFGGHLIGLIQLVACAMVALTQAWVVFDIDGDRSLHCGVDDTRNDTYCLPGTTVLLMTREHER